MLTCNLPNNADTPAARCLGTIPRGLAPRLICHCGIQVPMDVAVECGGLAQRAIISLRFAVGHSAPPVFINYASNNNDYSCHSSKVLERILRCSRIQPFVLIPAWLRSYHLGPLYLMINAKQLIHMCEWSLINKDLGVKWHIQMLGMNSVYLICVLANKAHS